MPTTLEELNISESNIHQMALVKDRAGNEYICNIKVLKDASRLSEAEKDQCILNLEDHRQYA